MAQVQEPPKPTTEGLLVEYQAAQDSAQHHDSLVWSINSVVWAGSLVLLGFILDHATEPGLKLILLILSVLGVLLSVKVWIYTHQLGALKKHKYDRCKEIERELGLRQHTTVHWASGRQKFLYNIVMLLFIIVWAAVAVTALCTKPTA